MQDAEKARFVIQQRAQLIQRVSMVMPIVDSLGKMIHPEMYSRIITERTSVAQMRELYTARLVPGGINIKAAFYNALEEHEPHLLEDLGAVLPSEDPKNSETQQLKSNLQKELKCLEELNQRVSMVMPIVDGLGKNVPPEIYAMIKTEKTRMDQMMELYTRLDPGGTNIKAAFYSALEQHEHHPLESLETQQLKSNLPAWSGLMLQKEQEKCLEEWKKISQAPNKPLHQIFTEVHITKGESEEDSNEKMALTDDIFNLNGVGRSEAFEDLYFHKFGRHGDAIKEKIWKKTLAGINKHKVLFDELMRNKGHCHGNTTEEESMKKMMRWLSKQVVQKTFQKAGTTSHATEFETLLPGISALIGQTIAEVAIDKGVSDYHPGNVTMKGTHVSLHERLILHLVGRGKIKNNWAYINTGGVQGKICVGTYSSRDTVYCKTYSNEYRTSHCDTFVMSAGNEQTGSFQVRVWDRSDKVICHLDKVFFSDFVHVGTDQFGRCCVAHGKGELWGTGGGTVSIHP